MNEKEDGEMPILLFVRSIQPEGLRLVGLFAIAVVIDIARTLQRDFIRRLRTALLLSRLRLGRGRFGGFACLRGLCATDRAYHMFEDRRVGRKL